MEVNEQSPDVSLHERVEVVRVKRRRADAAAEALLVHNASTNGPAPQPFPKRLRPDQALLQQLSAGLTLDDQEHAGADQPGRGSPDSKGFGNGASGGGHSSSLTGGGRGRRFRRVCTLEPSQLKGMTPAQVLELMQAAAAAAAGTGGAPQPDEQQEGGQDQQQQAPRRRVARHPLRSLAAAAAPEQPSLASQEAAATPPEHPAQTTNPDSSSTQPGPQLQPAEVQQPAPLAGSAGAQVVYKQIRNKRPLPGGGEEEAGGEDEWVGAEPPGTTTAAPAAVHDPLLDPTRFQLFDLVRTSASTGSGGGRRSRQRASRAGSRPPGAPAEQHQAEPAGRAQRRRVEGGPESVKGAAAGGDGGGVIGSAGAAAGSTGAEPGQDQGQQQQQQEEEALLAKFLPMVEEYLGGGSEVATAAAGTAPDSSAGGSTKQTTQGGASTAGGDDAGASRHVAQQVTHTEPAARGLTGDGGESEAGDWVYDVYLVADSTAGAPGQPCGPDAPIQLGRQHPGAASGGGTAEGESSGGEAMEVGGGEDPWAELPVVEVADSDDEFYWAWQEAGSMWEVPGAQRGMMPGWGGIDHDSEDSNAESYWGNSYPDEEEGDRGGDWDEEWEAEEAGPAGGRGGGHTSGKGGRDSWGGEEEDREGHYSSGESEEGGWGWVPDRHPGSGGGARARRGKDPDDEEYDLAEYHSSEEEDDARRGEDMPTRAGRIARAMLQAAVQRTAQAGARAAGALRLGSGHVVEEAEGAAEAPPHPQQAPQVMEM